MTEYKKSTFKDFKARLESGHYNSVAGARRAIGKMKELSDRQVKQAQSLVCEHFGVEEDAPKATKKKATKKKAAKKKVSKKTAAKKKTATKKKVSKKKKKAASKGKRRSSKASAQSAGSPNKRGRKSKSSKKETSEESSSPRQAKLRESQTKICSYREALEAMKMADTLGATSEVAEGAKAAARGLAAAVNEICALDDEPSEEEQRAAAAMEKAAAASAASRGSNGIGENAAANPQLPSPTPPAPPQG